MSKKKRKQQNSIRSFFMGLFEPAEENEIDFFSDEPDDSEVISFFDEDELEELGISDDTAARENTVLRQDAPAAIQPAVTAETTESEIVASPEVSFGDDAAPSEALSGDDATASPASFDSSAPGAAFFLERNMAPARERRTDISQAVPAGHTFTAPAPALSGEDKSGAVSHTGSSASDEALTVPDDTPALDEAAPSAEATESSASSAESSVSQVSIPSVSDTTETAEQEAAPIRLFDDDEEDTPSKPTIHGTAAIPKVRASGTVQTHARTLRAGSGNVRINFRETESTRKNTVIRERVRSEEEAVLRTKEEKRKRSKKKRLGFLKETALNIFFVGAIAAGVLVALWYTFLLRGVVVVGNETVDSEYIVGLTGLVKGTHMLFCDLDAAEANVAADPYLQVDAVEYIFPARVRIRVTERKEAAGIVGLDYNVIIDHSGYVLSMGSGTDLSHLLQVTGISMSGFQVGQRIGQSTDFSTAALVSIINALETFDLSDSITSIDMTTPLAVTMMANSGLKIFLGQPTELNDKMLSLYKILPSLTNSGVSSGTLYLSAKGGAVYSPVNNGAVTGGATAGETAEDGTVSGIEDDDAGTVPVTPIITPKPVATPQPIQPGGDDAFQG